MIKVFTQNISLIISISMNSIKYLISKSLLIIKKLIFNILIVNLEYNLIKNYTANIETNYHYNTDCINIKSYLLFYIDSCESGGFKFSNITHMIINTISCKCNKSFKYFINHPMSMLERRINFIIARNPQLINSIDRNKNHPLINKYSHIPFKNI